jgi:hypothetical protein
MSVVMARSSLQRVDRGGRFERGERWLPKRSTRKVLRNTEEEEEFYMQGVHVRPLTFY